MPDIVFASTDELKRLYKRYANIAVLKGDHDKLPFWLLCRRKEISTPGAARDCIKAELDERAGKITEREARKKQEKIALGEVRFLKAAQRAKGTGFISKRAAKAPAYKRVASKKAKKYVRRGLKQKGLKVYRSKKGQYQNVRGKRVYIRTKVSR